MKVTKHLFLSAAVMTLTACSNDDEIRHTIADVYSRTGYILDPHGACGYRGLKDYMMSKV